MPRLSQESEHIIGSAPFDSRYHSLHGRLGTIGRLADAAVSAAGVDGTNRLFMDDYYTGNSEVLANERLLKLWPDILNVVSLGPRDLPVDTYEQTLVVGGRGDTMLELAVRAEGLRDRGADLGTIIYLAEMRVAEGDFDERAIRYLRKIGHEGEVETETDIADAIIRQVHHADLSLERRQKVESVKEEPNALGPRKFTDRLYIDDAGRPVILINGAAVLRDFRKQIGGRGLDERNNRHTTKSVLEEWLKMYPPQKNSRVLMMAATPSRAKLELQRLLMTKEAQGADIVPDGVVMPPAKLQIPLLLSELAAMHKLSVLLAADDTHNESESIAIAAAQEQDISKSLEYVRSYLLHVLAMAGPYNTEKVNLDSYEPGRILDEYIELALGGQTERRVDHDALFPEHPKARALTLDLLRDLGMESHESTDVAQLETGKNYIFLSEGGTGVKMKNQLDMLPNDPDKQPTAIILSGADWRTISVSGDDHRGERGETAQLLGISEEGVGNTEYEVAVQFASQLVAESLNADLLVGYSLEKQALETCSGQEEKEPMFSFHGYTESGTPVYTMRQIRTDPISGSYDSLGVEGTIRVVSELARSEPFNQYLEDQLQIDSLCFSTAALYAPTRRIASTKLNIETAKGHTNTLPVEVATYGRTGDTRGPVSQRHAASEAVALLRLIRSA